ncbi:DUF4124 domain-containing protein [Luteimonas sp. SJ-92]|uniref:DUF4124 domain-containing protein n=1 Tax=Luteimonas salinisoli TaxID=2752307 RepID=A0A853J9K3_9GAMM|nr:DUF4124 domain-containing protein [Luteimonas salinisoli]NZA25823.1 DUF4124 domain-containing protein [Luteimonas salinisoli]
MRRHLITAAALLLAVPAAAQQTIVIYHCTDAGGAVTVQNDAPCPAGTTQRTREIDPPPPLPAYVPMAPPPEPAASTLVPLAPLTAGERPPDDPAAVAARAIDLRSLPPPPLYQCVTYDQNRYFTADAEPQSRCQPMQTVGIGGLQGLGAGAACIRVVDTCAPVPEQALCEAWRARLDEAEFRLKFARGHYDTRARRDEYAALERTLDASTCAGVGDR